MATTRPGAWVPTLLGTCAAVLASVTLLAWPLIPAARTGTVVLGIAVSGAAALAVRVVKFLFFAWAAGSCFARKGFAVYVGIGYLGYLIASVWVRMLFYGAEGAQRVETPFLVNGSLTAMLLGFCRVIWQRRAAFDA